MWVTSRFLLEVSALFKHRLSLAPLALFVLQLAAASLGAATAAAQNPYDTNQRDLARAAKTFGREARGVNPLLELMGGWDDSTPARVHAAGTT